MVNQFSAEERNCWLALAKMPMMGPSRMQQLRKKFGSLTALFQNPTHFAKNKQISPKLLAYLKQPRWDLVQEDLDFEAGSGCFLITLIDAQYPEPLKHIPSPPTILYGMGNMQALHYPQLAMVGSRNPTAYGKEAAFEFARALSFEGLTITSGLALGIDAASHQGALSANATTVAVAGTGLNTIYPKSNQRIAYKILENGAIISEYAPKVGPKPANFPRRNRIISGLSLGVLVVEATIKSGSLITAKYALEQGREIFALPGSIHNPMAKGCHSLIREGAKLVDSTQDLLDELYPLISKEKQELNQNLIDKKPSNSLQDHPDSDYTKIIESISFDGTTIDTLIERTQFSASTVTRMLMHLELQGLIESIPGGFARIRRPSV